MIGFAKYKMLKWLLSDICNVGDCEGCEMDHGDYPWCDSMVKTILKQARKAWGIE